MRISVVVPTLNAEGAVAQCLSSLYEQSHAADEIIVVDGASSDSTAEEVEEFSEAYFLSDPRYDTPGGARNAGAQRATGDIVFFTDSDCVAHYRLLENHERAHVSMKGLDGVVGHVRSAAEGPVAEMVQRQLMTQEWTDNLNPDGTIRFRSPGVQNLSVRREVILGYPFREDMVSGEDTDLYLRMKEANLRVLFEPRAVVFHRHATTLPELFEKFRWYGQGFYELAKLWPQGSFRKNSIHGTSLRFLDWSGQELRSAVVEDHSLICKECSYGLCVIFAHRIDSERELSQDLFRQVACFGYAAGVLQMRKGYIHDWPGGEASTPQA